jgi:hypothetical protein
MVRLPLALAVAVAAALLPSILAGTDDHRYKNGEHVELWVNKVSQFCRMVKPEGWKHPRRIVTTLANIL